MRVDTFVLNLSEFHIDLGAILTGGHGVKNRMTTSMGEMDKDAEDSERRNLARARAANLLPTLARVELGVLALQFFLGMTLNLFITLPATDPLSAGSSQTAPLLIHILVGFVLLGLPIGMVVVTWRAGDRTATAIAAVSLVTVSLAGIGGLRWLFGGQDNDYSFLMSTGFILTVLLQSLLMSRASALKVQLSNAGPGQERGRG